MKNSFYSPVNIIVGRFQPFTNGHLKCIKEAYRHNGLPTVLCIINTTDDKVNERKPFPTKLMYHYIDQLIKNIPEIAGYILINSADILKISEELIRNKYMPFCWVCGEDRYDSYNKMVIRYKNDISCSMNFHVLKIDRNADDISATEVRNAILNNDYQSFIQMIPANEINDSEFTYKFYKQLQNQLNSIINNETR